MTFASVIGTPNLVYVEHAGSPQKLDFMRPKTTGAHPLVVFIHGGGWAEGDKGGFRDAALRLASLGYAVASVNYRLSADVHPSFPAAEQDVRCAVQYLKAGAPANGINPDRVFVAGTSAGGHLASLLATTPNDPSFDSPDCKYSKQSSAVRGVASFYGPQDFTHFELSPDSSRKIAAFLGQTPSANPAIARQASPLSHVSAGAPPFFIAHGSADRTVPVAQSRTMKQALDRVHVENVYVELAGAPHGFPIFGPDPRLRPATCTFLSFLNQLR